MSVVTGGNIGEFNSGSKLTYDDFLLFPDDGRRHELIDGEHFVTASPNLKHQVIVMSLGKCPTCSISPTSGHPR